MHPVRKPTWQQATALVSLSTCGAMTGFAFAHGTVGDMTSPTRMPVHLLALKKPAEPVSASDSALRSAIVNVASYYLRMAQTKSPAEMEAIIWASDSVDGVDHGESCAAFASLTLALGAQANGAASWVTGGTTYPWPLHQWADVRVDPNPASPGIISVLQDAQAHHRWHPIGDGYQPQPGDWVMFDGHVEVVTRYSAGVLYTIGGDSGPNLSVNAHTYTGPLAAQGVTGFVNNGELVGCRDVRPAAARAGGTADGSGEPGGVLAAGPGSRSAITAERGRGGGALERARPPLTSSASRKGTARMVGTAGGTGSAGTQNMVAMPGVMAGAGMVAGNGAGGTATRRRRATLRAAVRQGERHGTSAGGSGWQRQRAAAIPGVQATADRLRGSSTPTYNQEQPARRRVARPGHRQPAGLHQPGRAGRPGRAKSVRHPGSGHDRPGHRRVRLGSERAGSQG